MPSPLRAPLLVLAACALGACWSPAERRQEIDSITAAWDDVVDEDSHEELIDHVRELGRGDPSRDPTDLASLTVLTSLAQRNPSGLVRAEALRAAWRLAARLPAEPIPREGLDATGFSERSRRFDELTADPGSADATGPEALELARFLGRYRAPPETQPARQRHPVDLAHMVVSRALWTTDSSVRRELAAAAPGSARHALSLVTLYAADDRDTAVREEALRHARLLWPQSALDLIAGAFSLETDGQVLHAALDSLTTLARRADLPAESRARLPEVLGLLDDPPDVSLGARVRALATELAP